MIYLILSRNYVKIGYTSDIKKRMSLYKTCNPDFKLIDTVEGDEKLEKHIHNLFREFKVKDRREWFYLNQFIIDTWINLHLDLHVPEMSAENVLIKVNNIDISYKDKYEESLKVISTLLEDRNRLLKLNSNYDEEIRELTIRNSELSLQIEDIKEVKENISANTDEIKSLRKDFELLKRALVEKDKIIAKYEGREIIVD